MYHYEGYSFISTEPHASVQYSTQPTSRSDTYGSGEPLGNFPPCRQSRTKGPRQELDFIWGERHRDERLDEPARGAETLIDGGEAFHHMHSTEDPTSSYLLTGHHFDETIIAPMNQYGRHSSLDFWSTTLDVRNVGTAHFASGSSPHHDLSSPLDSYANHEYPSEIQAMDLPGLPSHTSYKVPSGQALMTTQQLLSPPWDPLRLTNDESTPGSQVKISTCLPMHSPGALLGTTIQGSSPSWNRVRSRNDQSAPKFRATSRDSSPVNSPEVLLCEHDGCPMLFTGRYRRGTLHRHMSLKHRSGAEEPKIPRKFCCRFRDCNKSFSRTDARLIHYRKHHFKIQEVTSARRDDVLEAVIKNRGSEPRKQISPNREFDYHSNSSAAACVDIKEPVVEDPSSLGLDESQDNEYDANTAKDVSICFAASGQKEELFEAGISTACNSDMDLETQTSLVVKEEQKEIHPLLNSVERLDIQDLNDDAHYQSHSGGAQDGHHTTTTPNSNIGHRGTDAATSQNFAHPKRLLERDLGQDEDGEDNQGARKKPKRIPTAGEVLDEPLACPFAKHNPFKYPNCWSFATDNTPHLKQHLKRDHSNPKHYCPVCGREFIGKNAGTDKDKHLYDRLCVPDVTGIARWHGITADQEQQIKRSKPRSMNTKQYWNCIYGILFASEPPVHPHPEDFVNLGLQLFRNDVTADFAAQLKEQSEQTSTAMHDLHNNDYIAQTLFPELPMVLNRAFDNVIKQRQGAGRPHLSASEGSILGASTYPSESGYASRETNSTSEDGAPTASSPEYASRSEALAQPQELFDGQTLDQMNDAHFQSQWDHEVYEKDNYVAEQPPMIFVADHDKEAQNEVNYDFMRELEERHGRSSEPYVNPADVEIQQ